MHCRSDGTRDSDTTNAGNHGIEYVAVDLLGREVTATQAEMNLADEQLFNATMIDDDDELAGAIIADLHFACNAGGSLVMLPVPTVNKAIDSGVLEDPFRENYYEVANILSALLNGPAVVHVRIGALLDGIDDETRDLLLRAPGRRAFDVDISGYGSGTIAFYAT